MYALMMLTAALTTAQAVAAPPPAAASVPVQADAVLTPGTVTVEPMAEDAGPAVALFGSVVEPLPGYLRPLTLVFVPRHVRARLQADPNRWAILRRSREGRGRGR